jgi:hypothetical protein
MNATATGCPHSYRKMLKNGCGRYSHSMLMKKWLDKMLVSNLLVICDKRGMANTGKKSLINMTLILCL